MQLREIKETIATLSVVELADVETFIHDLMQARDKGLEPSAPSISFEEAAAHVRTDYAHLLHKLSQ
jgi:hypothetical protein